MILYTPLGKTISDPSDDDIRELLKKDDSYWNQGSGSASLSIDLIQNSKEALMFYRISQYGYVVLQLDSYKAPIDEEKDISSIVVHDVGGEPFPVPLCFFISYSQAEKILLQYSQNITIPDYEQWCDIYERFDYDAYLESEEYYKGIKIFKNPHAGNV